MFFIKIALGINFYVLFLQPESTNIERNLLIEL